MQLDAELWDPAGCARKVNILTYAIKIERHRTIVNKMPRKLKTVLVQAGDR
jgi:hypothetical protein